MAIAARRRPAPLESLVASALLLVVGQLLQIALGPYSRIQGTFTVRSGIALLAPDSRYYLRSSESLSSLLEASWTNWTYLLVGRLAHLSGDAASMIVVLQLLTVLAVGAVLHRAVQRVAGNAGALIALAAFSVNPFVAQWFRFVQTETLFFSLMVVLVLISGGLLARPPVSRKTVTALQIALGIAAAGMRPNGILVLLSVVLLVIWRSIGRGKALGISALVVASVPLLLTAVLSSAGQPAEGSVTSQLYDGVVVEGTDEVRVRIAMPRPPAPEDESLGAAVRYAAGEPVATARLVTTRMIVEILQIRPHYPTVVNGGAAAVILIYLGLALAGATTPPGAALRAPVITLMVPLILIVGLTFASPEARYGWGGLVAAVPLVGIGAGRMLGDRSAERGRAPGGRG